MHDASLCDVYTALRFCAKPGGEEALCLMRNRLHIEPGSVFLHRLRFADLTVETCLDGTIYGGAVHMVTQWHHFTSLSVVGCAFERNSGSVRPHPLHASSVG